MLNVSICQQKDQAQMSTNGLLLTCWFGCTSATEPARTSNGSHANAKPHDIFSCLRKREGKRRRERNGWEKACEDALYSHVHAQAQWTKNKRGNWKKKN